MSVIEEDRPYPVQATRQGDVTELRIAPFMVLRVAGLPARFASQLPGCQASEVAASRRALLSRQETLASQLVDALFEAIAHPQADRVRAVLLKGKRDVHGRKDLRLGAAENWLMQALPETHALCQEYVAVRQASADLCEQLSQAIEADNAATRSLLHEAMQVPDFCQALGLAVPRLFAQLDERGAEWSAKRRKQGERTLLAYALRASTKISPFSYFASSCLAQVDLTRREGTLVEDRWAVRTESHLNRAIAVALREALYSVHSVAERNLHVSANPTLRFGNHVVTASDRTDGMRVSGYLRAYQPRRGSLWSEETLLNSALNPLLCSVLENLPSSIKWSELIQRLLVVEPEAGQAARLARQLMRKDILRPAIQWGAHCIKPALHLANALDSDARECAFAQRLRALDEQASAFARTPAQNRGDAIASLNADFKKLFGDLTTQVPPELVAPIYEDAWSEGLTARFGSDFAEKTLHRIAEAVGRRAALSLDYLWLRERFLRIYGEGGRCNDLAGFLADAWQPYMEFGQHAANGTPIAAPSSAGIAFATLRLPLTVYFQIASNNLDEALNGEPLIVINGAYSRIGWQLSRSTSLDIVQGSTRTEMVSQWIAQAAGTSKPVTLSVSGESSNLQVHQRMAAHHLCLDEQPSVPGDLLLSDLQLVHDPDTGLIGLRGLDDEPFALQYLGGASPMTAWGIKHLLIALAEPMQIGRPAMHAIIAGPQDDDFRHEPRIQENGCVLVRETWWLRSRVFLSRVTGLEAHKQVEAVLALCASSGIPEEVFVNGQFDDFFSWKSFAAVKARKPVWSRMSNAFCIDYLIGLAQETDWLVFHEAMPAPHSSWLRIAEQPFVSELHAEMVLIGGSPSAGWTL